MSKIDDLIAELCPDGVPYIAVGDLCIVQTGSQLNKETLTNTGVYPVYNGGIFPSGYHEDFNTAACTIAISQGGASAGFVNWVDVPFYAGAHCYTVKNVSQQVLNRFLYFFLKNEQNQIQNAKHGAGIPGLNSKAIKTLQIPLPPLQVQHEIVRILDKFTTLEAELEAELEARKKQYEFYRDSLLNKDVNIRPLKEILISSRSGGTPLKSKKEYYENGTIPWLRTQEVVFNEISKTDCFITELAVKETSAKWVPANCVVVAISGASAGRCAINKIPLTTNQHCLCIEIDPTIALYKYVFYCVSNQFEDLIAKKEGARGDLNSSRILSLEIPIPSLPDQRRIVDILDRFDTLVNDIAQGLPAEIAARKKQYEYYRNKLLTFKEKTS